MRTRIFAAATIGLIFAARTATATECSGVLSPCINSDNLWPHAGPARFVAVGSDQTVAARQLGFGLVTSVSSRPIVLSLRSPGNGSDAYVVDNQLDLTFLWAYGLTDRLELDLALPITAFQNGAGLSPVTGGETLHASATRDLRFGFTYALVPQPRPRHDAVEAPYGQRDGWGAAARFEVSAPTGDRDQFAGERTAVFVPSVAWNGRLDRWFSGAEVGARIRPHADLLGTEVASQIVASVGGGFDILDHERLSVALEAFALPTLAKQRTVVLEDDTLTKSPTSTGTVVAPAEWLLSARTAPLASGHFSIALGGGGALPIAGNTELSPRFRFTLALRWAPTARETAHEAEAAAHDTDGDGIPDSADACPTDPGRGSADGCPPVGSTLP